MRVALCYDLLRFCLCSSICVIDSRFRSPISYHFTPQHTIPPLSSTGTTKNCHHPRQGTSKFDSDHRRYDGYYSRYDVPSAFVHLNCLRANNNQQQLSYFIYNNNNEDESVSQSASLVQSSRDQSQKRSKSQLPNLREEMDVLSVRLPTSNHTYEYSLSDLIQGASHKPETSYCLLYQFIRSNIGGELLLRVSLSDLTRHEGSVTLESI